MLVNGSPELVEMVDGGELAYPLAADIAALPKADQIDMLAVPKSEIYARYEELRAGDEARRREERLTRITEIARGNAALPGSERYPIIYADPPWRYEHAISTSREIENQYPTMSLAEICELDVANIATDDAILYVWAQRRSWPNASRSSTHGASAIGRTLCG